MAPRTVPQKMATPRRISFLAIDFVLPCMRGRIASMDQERPKIDRDKIATFCRQNSIRRLGLFGSILRDDFTETSDVDVLVEFEPGARTGLAFFRMQDDLSKIIGRQVDLNTPGFLAAGIRERVLQETKDIYVAA